MELVLTMLDENENDNDISNLILLIMENLFEKDRDFIGTSSILKFNINNYISGIVTENNQWKFKLVINSNKYFSNWYRSYGELSAWWMEWI